MTPTRPEQGLLCTR